LAELSGVPNRHLHRCFGCGAVSAAACECDAPWEYENCPDRVPGERQADCELARAVGRDDLTELMVAEYEGRSPRRLR